ncbi:MAG: UDP-N-acetylmuramate dehydrogenase [Patescibacteria group bacterium]
MLAKLQQLISPDVKENEPLAPYTTYRIGGPADYFFAAPTADDAVRALAVVQELGLPYFVLGGGSNVLVSDDGFRGLVIKLANRGIRISGSSVEVEAGTPTALVALQTTEAGLTGFEWAIGLPGTFGGAVRGNAGMLGGETGNSIQSVRCVRHGAVEELSREQCSFSYRQSVFKSNPGCIILSAVLALRPAEQPEVGKQKLQEILASKKDSQPVEYPTAGCIFKNWQPDSPEDVAGLRRWLDLNPDETVPLAANGTVPAGWLIDRAQMKGTKVGGARISEKHANFFVNEQGASANDVIGLIAVVKTRIRNMTQARVQLQEEIEYVGF